MAYVNFGSNWCGKKDGTNILPIFLKYNIAFAGDNNYVNNIATFKSGDKIAITDGTSIVAVGIAETDFNSLRNFNISFTDEELDIFYNENFEENEEEEYAIYEDWVTAVKIVKLFKLKEEDRTSYGGQGVTVKGINKTEIQIYIDNLLKKYSGELAMEEYIKLLKENYNLIFTGAPGTGKTYLAKQIAAKIIFDDDKKEYTESLEEDENFKNQYEFVQFHPSYDYTDFVEGLRPINNNGNIGFERKDGVFKEFCKKALKNLIDSQKDISQLNEDAIIKNNLLKFIEDVSNEIDENGYFEINCFKKKKKLKEIELENETLYFILDIKSSKPIKLTLDKLVEFYEIFYKRLKIGKEWYYENFRNEFSKDRPSYKYGFLKSFYENYNSKIEELKNSNTNTVEKIEKKNFVFIIDEINRGEISKIFGELFFAIDPGYRGIKGKVLTQYSNLIDEELEKYFYIPENVYIIGTMNDIDRSVESMDFAMRRRFAWKEVNAKDTQESILKDLDDSIKQDAIDRMNNLNKAIYDEEKKTSICELSSAYHIGASYFLKLKNYYNGNNKEDAFKSLWDNHLKGLLFEYLRGMPDINDKLIKLENAYDTVSSNTSQTGGTAQSGNTLQTNSTTQTSNITQDNDTN